MSLLTTASLVVTPNANKTSKLYSVIPSNGNGDFTVTRATTATRTNSAGLIESTTANMVRRDYSLGSCPNLLLEPQRTNLALRSEEFDNASWTKLNVSITANAITSPSGIINADKIIESSATGFHGALQLIPGTVGASHTFSVFLKAGERNWALVWFDADGAGAYVDLSNGNLGTISAGVTAVVTNVGNGWYKCAITKTIATAANVRVFTANVNNGVSYTGDGTSGLYLWGAQLEAGAYATSYIPTTTASVTRNADQISLSNVYTNGLISASGGTWFVELRGNVPRIRDLSSQFWLGDTASTSLVNAFTFRGQTSSSRLTISKVVAATTTTIFTTTTDTVKVAIKWNGSTADVFANGVKVVTATAFTTTNMEFLNCFAADVPKYINQMALWATPLTDTQLTQLTTL